MDNISFEELSVVNSLFREVEVIGLFVVDIVTDVVVEVVV